MNCSKFKSQFLALSMVACFAVANAGVIGGRETTGPSNLGKTTANNLALNPDGYGHMLLVPYFSAQSGNASILSLTNTDYLNAKAVKLRFRSASGGDTVLDLTVFLAPNDVWNGVVTANPVTGLAQLSSADSSCSLPMLASGNVLNFSTKRLRSDVSAEEQKAQTREGNVEIIVMADIPADSAIANGVGSLYKAVSLKGGGQRNCGAASVVATQVDTTSESVAVGLGFATPTTGLQGTWTIVNVPKTLTFSGDALALEARDGAGLAARANFVFFPQSDEPAKGVDGLTSDPVMRSAPLVVKSAAGVGSAYLPLTGGLPIVAANLSDFPDMSTPYLEGMSMPTFQAAALSKVLAVKSVINEFSSELSIGAATDWIIGMPTKRYTVGVDARQSEPVLVYSVVPGMGNAEYFSSVNSTFVTQSICTVIGTPTYFDRDSSAQNSNVGASAPMRLCGNTSIVQFAGESALAGSQAVTRVGTAAAMNGWAKLDTANTTRLSTEVVTTGMPIVGASFIRASNPGAAPNVSGNYGIVSPHSFTR